MLNKKRLHIAVSLLVASALITGCSYTQKIEPSSIKDFNLSEAMLEKDNQIVKQAKDATSASVSGEFYQSSAFAAVKALGEQAGIPVDQSFIPSEKYRVSIDVNSSLGVFLKYVKTTTGIDYRYRNGKLTIVNKDLVDQSIAGKQCHIGAQPTVIMSFKDVSPNQVFKYFSDNYGMSFVYKTKYSDLTDSKEDLQSMAQMGPGQTTQLPKAKPVSLNYSGCDPKEAFRMFIAANNLIAEEVTPGSYNIMDYEVANIDVSLYYDYKYTSAGGVGGSSSTSTGGQTSSTGSSGASSSGSGGMLTMEENPKRDLTDLLQKFLGPKGKVVISNRGFATIEDTPENIRAAKRIIAKDIAKQKPIELQVSVLRIDVSNSNKTGVDWDAVLGTWNFSGGPKMLSYTSSYASDFSGGGAFSLTGGSKTQLIRLLETYGKTNVVRSFRTRARSGILETFKAVEQIPYVTTTTTSSTAGYQSNVEAKIAEAGLIINVVPYYDKSNESVDLSTSIVVSEYLGDKTFQMSSGTFMLPRIATNELKIPAKIQIGQTIVLTGFKIATGGKNAEGLPGFIHIPVIGGLAGMDSANSSESEFVIVITPAEIAEA